MLAAFSSIDRLRGDLQVFRSSRPSRWPSIPGKIVASTTEARPREVRRARWDDTELRNFAKVVFRIQSRDPHAVAVTASASAKTWATTRWPRRWPGMPVGKDVTVYYNPNRRDQALIERDAPPGLWKRRFVCRARHASRSSWWPCSASRSLARWSGFDRPQHRARAVRGGPASASRSSRHSTCRGFRRAAARTRAWPTVAGQIASSGVHKFHEIELERTLGRAGKLSIARK